MSLLYGKFIIANVYSILNSNNTGRKAFVYRIYSFRFHNICLSDLFVAFSLHSGMNESVAHIITIHQCDY